MVFRFRLRTALILVLVGFPPQLTKASTKWTGQIPAKYEKPEDWTELLNALNEKKMFYGIRAASERALLYFTDLKLKERAYQEIVSLIDRGYRYDLRELFSAGDLDLKGTDKFSQSYNFYKSLINTKKKMEKWSQYYLDRVDKENFPKFLFHEAVQAYSQGKIEEALQLLGKTLSLLTQPADMAFAKKVARTMARIHYERGDFNKSWEIYDTYLLRLNPIEPKDWVEGAWNLYQLGMYPEAIGILYNLESEAAEGEIYLEKYVIRALIYKHYCLYGNVKLMMADFEQKYGKTIEAIKMGEPVNTQPLIAKVSVPGHAAYEAYERNLQELNIERKRLPELPSKLRGIARFLYDSEIKAVMQKMQSGADLALQARAKYLVIMGEGLRFMTFDVAREKYNPEKVFAKKEEAAPVIDSKLLAFQKYWFQYGDFWRDERMLFNAEVKNLCK